MEREEGSGQGPEVGTAQIKYVPFTPGAPPGPFASEVTRTLHLGPPSRRSHPFIWRDKGHITLGVGSGPGLTRGRVGGHPRIRDWSRRRTHPGSGLDPHTKRSITFRLGRGGGRNHPDLSLPQTFG